MAAADQPPDGALLRGQYSSTSDALLSPLSARSGGSFSVTFDSLAAQQQPLRRRVTDEVFRLTKLSGPLFIQNLLAYSTTVIAVAFVGHLNQPELLSSAVLANSLYNVSGYSLLSGLASGMESLCGQAFGARSYKALGLVLQRALLINWAMCIPITLLWTHSEKLLLLLGQQPSVATGASLYLRIITPTLYAGAVVECLKRYLLAQRVVLPGMVVTVLTCLLAPLYNWLFIFRLHMGLAGAALAFTCSQGTTALLLVLYVVYRDASMAARQHEQATWCRPGRAMFAGWGTYLSYGLPATIQLCTEWWSYEVVIFMAGMSHNAEVAQGVMGLLFQISACAYMSALAFGSSINTRVGNELGAGNADAARLSVFTCVVAVALVQSLLAVGCKLADKGVVGLLTNNPEVAALTLDTMPVLLPTFVFDALNCAAQGILRGAGRPGLGAVLNSAGYWAVGVPLAAYLGLYLQLSVKGFWSALLTTSTVMAVVQLAVIVRFNWEAEVERAARMLEQHEDSAADAKAAGLGAATAAGGSGVGGACGVSDVGAAAAPEGSITDSDVAPLLPADRRQQQQQQQRLGANKQGTRVAGRAVGQRSSSERDQGGSIPVRPSRLSQSGPSQQQDVVGVGAGGGNSSHSHSSSRPASPSWLPQWLTAGPAAAPSALPASESLQQHPRQLAQQSSLTRSLLRSSSSLTAGDRSQSCGELVS